jgi:hypothetical protein
LDRFAFKSAVACGLTAAAAVASGLGVVAGSETATYTLPLGDLYRNVPLTTQPVEENFNCGGSQEGKVAGACMAVGGSSVHVVVADKTGQPTPTRIFFYDGDKHDITPDNGSPTLLCGAGDVALPDGTAFISVEIGVLGRSGISTPPSGVPTMACPTPEPASTGTITVSGDGVRGSRAESAQSAGAVAEVAHHQAVPAISRAWVAARVRHQHSREL